MCTEGLFAIVRRAAVELVLVLGAATILITPVTAQGTAACPANLFLLKKITCFVTHAERRHDPSFCMKAKDPVRFQCVSHYAEDMKDEAACELLFGPDKKSHSLRDACVTGVAVAAKDIAACKHAQSRNSVDACYWLMVLKQGADPALCDRIESPVLKKMCKNPQ